MSPFTRLSLACPVKVPELTTILQAKTGLEDKNRARAQRYYARSREFKETIGVKRKVAGAPEEEGDAQGEDGKDLAGAEARADRSGSGSGPCSTGEGLGNHEAWFLRIMQAHDK